MFASAFASAIVASISASIPSCGSSAASASSSHCSNRRTMSSRFMSRAPGPSAIGRQPSAISHSRLPPLHPLQPWTVADEPPRTHLVSEERRERCSGIGGKQAVAQTPAAVAKNLVRVANLLEFLGGSIRRAFPHFQQIGRPDFFIGRILRDAQHFDGVHGLLLLSCAPAFTSAAVSCAVSWISE